MAMYWALKAEECGDANVLERLKDAAKMNGCAHCGKKTLSLMACQVQNQILLWKRLSAEFLKKLAQARMFQCDKIIIMRKDMWVWVDRRNVVLSLFITLLT
jgi:hypothetical protein